MLLGVVSAALGGRYQINATVSTGIGGPAPVTISSACAVSQAGVIMMLMASMSSGGTPVISSIDTDGGFPTIAQNGWIEIRDRTSRPPASEPAWFGIKRPISCSAKCPRSLAASARWSTASPPSSIFRIHGTIASRWISEAIGDG